MAFGDRKPREEPKKPPEPKPDADDTVRVSEQLLIVKAAETDEMLDEIAKADRRPGVQIAIRARRDELAQIRVMAAAIIKGGMPAVKAPEGMVAHDMARRVAQDSPPSGKTGKSCAKCENRITLPRTYSTLDCEKIRPGSRITVATPTAEQCEYYKPVEA